jgi:hypothetical protein
VTSIGDLAFRRATSIVRAVPGGSGKRVLESSVAPDPKTPRAALGTPIDTRGNAHVSRRGSHGVDDATRSITACEGE